MAQILRQSTQIKVVIGPVVAVANGYVPVTTLTLSGADEAEIMKSDASAVTDISAATFAAITGADGYYNLTLTTSHTDTCGLLTVLINDDSLCLPVKATFQVLEEAVFDALYAASANAWSGAAGSTTLTALASGSITAAVIATGAIDADAIADNAIDAGAIAADAITAAKIADGAIDAATFAAGAINAAAIASDAITDAKVASDVTIASVTGSVGSVTGNVGGNVVGSVASVTAGVTLANGAHGGTSAVITAERIVVASTTTNEPAMKLTGNGTAAGMLATGGATGHGFSVVGGATSGNGINVTTTSGHGINLAPVGTNMHGILATGGNGGTSDGVSLVAGTGGVGLRAGSLTVTGATTLSGAVQFGSTWGVTGAITFSSTWTGNITGNVTGSVGSLATQAKADVNAEVLDVLNTDTFAEPGQEAPAATNTLAKKIGYLFKLLRNKLTQSATELKVYADDGTTVDQKATISDDGTTYTRGEIGTGP